MLCYLTNNLRQEKGMAMIIVLPILLMITILGIAAIYNSNTDMEISGSVKRGSQAFYIAEAGLERAVNEYIWGNFFDENVSPISNPFGWIEGLSDSSFYSAIPLGSDGSYSTRITSVVNPLISSGIISHFFKSGSGNFLSTEQIIEILSVSSPSTSAYPIPTA